MEPYSVTLLRYLRHHQYVLKNISEPIKKYGVISSILILGKQYGANKRTKSHIGTSSVLLFVQIKHIFDPYYLIYSLKKV